MTNPFTEGYYLRGEGSNYHDYRWLPERTIPLAKRMMEVMGIKEYASVLDYGCARGYLVRALRELLCKPYGYDISEWAIANCDPYAYDRVSTQDPWYRNYDHIIAKDVLEHVELEDIHDTIADICKHTIKSLIIIVPLCAQGSNLYIRPEDNADTTHKIRWTRQIWEQALQLHSDGMVVYISPSIPRIKESAEDSPGSTGYFLLKRLHE